LHDRALKRDIKKGLLLKNEEKPSMIRFSLSVIATLLLLFASSAQAAHFNISFNAPPDREHYRPPQQHYRCYEVGSQVVQGVWINRHRVCENGRNPYQHAWVSGHWRCAQFSPVRNHCFNWEWIPSQWRGNRGHRVVYGPGRNEYMPRHRGHRGYDS
jgi:hypothetical protein